MLQWVIECGMALSGRGQQEAAQTEGPQGTQREGHSAVREHAQGVWWPVVPSVAGDASSGLSLPLWQVTPAPSGPSSKLGCGWSRPWLLGNSLPHTSPWWAAARAKIPFFLKPCRGGQLCVSPSQARLSRSSAGSRRTSPPRRLGFRTCRNTRLGSTSPQERAAKGSSERSSLSPTCVGTVTELTRRK